jgi:hypothetical protein
MTILQFIIVALAMQGTSAFFYRLYCFILYNLQLLGLPAEYYLSLHRENRCPPSMEISWHSVLLVAETDGPGENH